MSYKGMFAQFSFENEFHRGFKTFVRPSCAPGRRPRCSRWPRPRCQRNLPHGARSLWRRSLSPPYVPLELTRWPRSRPRHGPRSGPRRNTSLRSRPSLLRSPVVPARRPRRSCRDCRGELSCEFCGALREQPAVTEQQRRAQAMAESSRAGLHAARMEVRYCNPAALLRHKC